MLPARRHIRTFSHTTKISNPKNENNYNAWHLFDFLAENKVEHPERFVEPIVKSFSTMTADMHEGIVSSYKGGAFNVGPLLRVLDGQFSGSIEGIEAAHAKITGSYGNAPCQTSRL